MHCFLLRENSRMAKAFVWMDRYLDTTQTGPQHLIQPEIGTLVARSIQRGSALDHYHCAPGS